MFHFFGQKRATQAGPPIQHVQGYIFTPGAESVSYEPRFPVAPTMTLMDNFTGNGCLAGAAPSPINKIVYVYQSALVTGIGGPLTGQFIGQPLTVPVTTNGSQ